MNDRWTDRLSEYLDGELGAADVAALEAHLPACADCRAALGELRRVVARAQALEDRPPATDLWPEIARHLGVVSLDARPAPPPLSFTLPQPAPPPGPQALLS